MTDPAAEAIFGHKSAASLATGPVIYDPFISPLGSIMTPALSSQYTKTPSILLQGLLYLMMTPYMT